MRMRARKENLNWNILQSEVHLTPPESGASACRRPAQRRAQSGVPDWFWTPQFLILNEFKALWGIGDQPGKDPGGGPCWILFCWSAPRHCLQSRRRSCRKTPDPVRWTNRDFSGTASLRSGPWFAAGYLNIDFDVDLRWSPRSCPRESMGFPDLRVPGKTCLMRWSKLQRRISSCQSSWSVG